ncbi:tetratricopeptide repeat protein [Parablautia muri]|uniref:tetratricopeptide repeat protein n=1 Tax=Parablautia muri TaxID=2320879 RepID=UPI001369AED1|nr:hypothetical protein [Parablautia muri]
MDKYEYKVRADEIKSLIAEGEYAEAVKIADAIDWRRVKSVMMLCTISDLYKINRRYEDSRDILLLAYERHTGGRLIVYSLCELSIKLGEYVQALEYYKEFVQLAPKDSGRYILQYKLYEAQEVSLEERIEVLEELKKRDYREKWAYELAYLYHRVGLTSKCVEECDEMFLWFGEGRYVLKALELKMLHEPLSEEQQVKYEQMKETGGFIESDYAVDQQKMQEKAVEVTTEDEDDNEFSLEENILKNNTQEMPEKEELDIEVKTVDVSQYNTINLQKELAESMKEFLEENKVPDTTIPEDSGISRLMKTKVYEPVTGLDSQIHPEEKESVEMQDASLEEEVEEIQPEPINVPLKETSKDNIFLNVDFPDKKEDKTNISTEQPAAAPVNSGKAEIANSEEVFFGNTAEVNIQDVISELAEKNGSKSLFEPVKEQLGMAGEGDGKAQPEDEEVPLGRASADSAISNTGIIRTFHKKSGYDDMLSQDFDGQISLVVPEEEKIEKQITGQLSIEDIMAEWEKMKQENERKRMEDIRKRVHQQTDTLFADFDEATKSGLLEELEKVMVSAAIKEEKRRAAKERPKVVKAADMDKKAKEDDSTASEDAIKKRLLKEAVENAKDFEDFENKLNPLVAKILEADDEEAEVSAEESMDESLEKYPETDRILENSEEDSEEEYETEVNDLVEDVNEKDGAAADSISDNIDGEAEDTPDTENVRKKVPKGSLNLKGTKKVSAKAGESKAKGSKEKKEENTKKDEEEEKESRSTVREMTISEREQFAPFIHHKRTRRQIVEAIDNISMASYTGNVIITGEEGTGTIALAKLLVKEIQLSDNNFSGKVAKISGPTMNKKDVPATLSKLSGGALIIEGAASMKKDTVGQLLKELNQEEKGLIVLLEDMKAGMNNFLEKYPELKDVFNLRVDVEALDDQTLVKYAKKYALGQEYVIDELGVLALHTRIADMQTSDHEVTLTEIEELVDEAIYYADKKTPKHFFDVLLGKRYDEEDMIVLREKDFMHY